MFDFFNRLFGVQPSGQTAKERLKLVLLSDHLSLAPDVVEALKHDLLEVISRYVEVDVANCDVSFEQREKQVAMLANIPILGMQKRPSPPPPPPAPPPERTPKAARKTNANGQPATRRRRRKPQASPAVPHVQIPQGAAQPT